MSQNNSQNRENESEESFCQGVSSAVIDLIDSGLTDPSVDEIADHYFAQPYTTSIKGEIQSRLPYICGVVQEEFEHAHLVSDTYYNGFENTLPQSIDEAERCIPGGRGRNGVGIRIPQVENDYIYLAHARRNIHAGGRKCEVNLTKLHSAYLTGDVTGQELHEALRAWHDTLETAANVIKTLRNSGAMKGPLFSGDNNKIPALDS